MSNTTTASKDITITTIQGVDCYESNGVAYLKLESVAYGLGITKMDIKNGVSYTRPNNQKLRAWLESFGILSSENSEPLPEYIPENIFYRLAMKAKNKVAEEFQAKVADEIIPAIRKTGKYEVPKSVSTAVEISGPYLRQLRERKGITMAEVSRKTGVSYQCLAHFEKETKGWGFGKDKRVRVYNYLMTLPDAVFPLPTTPGNRYVTTVDPIDRRDYPVNDVTRSAPAVSPADLPITYEDFSELIKKEVVDALSTALVQAMTNIMDAVQKRGIDGAVGQSRRRR